MPDIDVVDSTWIPARAPVVAAAVADAANWRRWWPGLDLRIDEWRGPKGVRWSVASVAGDGGAGLTGTAEVWLEAMFEGVVAHFFLRLDPAPGAEVDRRTRTQVTRRCRVQAKRAFWALADQLDSGWLERHTCAARGSVT